MKFYNYLPIAQKYYVARTVQKKTTFINTKRIKHKHNEPNINEMLSSV